jgi:hypothetical protein
LATSLGYEQPPQSDKSVFMDLGGAGEPRGWR